MSPHNHHQHYNIRKRQLPSCAPFKSKATSTGIVSSKLTRAELEVASRNLKSKDIAAMAASRQRAILALKKRREAQQRGSDHIDASGQMRSLDIGVKLCARKYNDAKAQADKLEDEVRSRCDDLVGLERESKALHEMLQGNNSDAMKISRLSQEIQETNDSSDHTILYRHQLNYMRQRVRKNSVTMDYYMEEMSDILIVGEKEREWRKKMLAEVESGLSCASIELEETIHDTKIEEEKRIRELIALQSEAEDAARMEEWNRERMNNNLELQESFRDTNKEERERLQKAIGERKSQLQALQVSLEENAVKLGTVDECFAHIKHTTGVNSLKEMIMKISQHDTNHQRLVKEKKEVEERLRKDKLSLSNDQDSLDRMKTNGVGDIEWNRDVLDNLQASIANEKAEVKIAKSANERLEDLLVGIRQGSNGLFNRLLPFHSTLFLDEDAPKLGKIDLINATQAASDTLEMIQFTEKVLNKILGEIGGIRQVPKLDAGNESRPQTPGQDLNCRVSPTKTDLEKDTIDNAVSHASKDAVSEPDTSEENRTPTRKELKSNSANLREMHRIKHAHGTLLETAASYAASLPSRRDVVDRVNSVLEEVPSLE